MTLWNTLGDLFEGSGWTTALTEADVTPSGLADSFLMVSHLTWTRHAHQITLMTLSYLKKEFSRFALSVIWLTDTMTPGLKQYRRNFETLHAIYRNSAWWKSVPVQACTGRKASARGILDLSTIDWWRVTLNVLGSYPDTNPLFSSSSGLIGPKISFCVWMSIAIDHMNYARWTPVHITDIKSLPDALKDEFEK
jgi:hypothetical protein